MPPGVNAYLSKRGGPLPPEFFLTRAPKPEPWTPADSIGWSLMMAWDLARYSYSRELRRLQLAQRFSVAEINDFYPPYPGDAPPATADYAEMYRLLGLKAASVTALNVAPAFGFGDGEGVGSNNWVVSGKRTVSGKPHGGQRSASWTDDAFGLVFRRPAGAGLESDGCNAAWSSRRGSRPQRSNRVGVHEHRRRSAGSLSRAHQSRSRPTSIRRRRAGRALRRASSASASRAATMSN